MRKHLKWRTLDKVLLIVAIFALRNHVLGGQRTSAVRAEQGSKGSKFNVHGRKIDRVDLFEEQIILLLRVFIPHAKTERVVRRGIKSKAEKYCVAVAGCRRGVGGWRMRPSQVHLAAARAPATSPVDDARVRLVAAEATSRAATGQKKAKQDRPKQNLLVRALWSCMDRRGHSIHDLADALGVTYGYLLSIARGERPMNSVSRDILARAAEYLQIPLAQAYVWAVSPRPEYFYNSRSLAFELDALYEDLKNNTGSTSSFRPWRAGTTCRPVPSSQSPSCTRTCVASSSFHMCGHSERTLIARLASESGWPLESGRPD